MSCVEIKLKKVSPLLPDDRVPFYASEGAAAMDLAAAIDQPVTLQPGGRSLLPTGIAMKLPSAAYVALVFARSGLGVKKGICLSNGVGVIDSDYTGEIQVGLVNLSDEPYTIQPLERIAQLAVVPICRAAITLCDELEETKRGAGGFGSTGK